MSTYSYSSTNKSLAQIMQEREEARVKQVSKDLKKKDAQGEVKEFKPFKPYPSQDPEVTQLDKPDMVRQVFEKIPGMSPLHPISTKIEGVHMPTASSSGVVINPMTNNFTHSRVDGLAIAEQDNPALQLTPAAKELMVAVRQYCRTHYFGNGTINGLILRMKNQITSKPTIPTTQEDFEEICKWLPRRSLAKMSGDGATVMGISPEMNVEAAAGAPYFVPGIKIADVIEDVVLRAEKYLVILKDKGATGLNQYFINDKDPHMHEMVALLCPKKDIYDRNEYHYKVRPFGVFPSSLRILFACISTIIKPHMMNYLEDPESMSALGMSWTKGGAAQMLVHFDLKVSKSGYYPLSWGDDQLILIVARDGSSILTNPDVSGMDMKLDKDCFLLLKMWMLQGFTDIKLMISACEKIRDLRRAIPIDNLDNKWLSGINFFIHYMSNTPLMYYKQYLASKTRGMLSGINLTTVADEVTSGKINVHLRRLDIPDTFNPNTIQRYRNSMMKKATEIGFPFKEAETYIQLYTLPGGKPAQPNIVVGDKLERLPKGEVIGLKFLGQKIAKFTFPPEITDDGKAMTILVPKCDQVALLAGCALKIPDDKDALIRAGLLMCGLLGRGFNAITDINSYNYLKSLYDRHVSMNHHTIISTQDTDVGFENLPLKEACLSADYPSIYWFAKVFATDKEKENLTKVVLTRKSDNSVSSSTTKLNDSYSKLEIVGEELELTEIPKLHGSAIQHALELVQDDLEDISDGPLSSATMHNPKKAVGKQASEEPAVHAIRAANLIRYMKRFEKKRLRMERLRALQERYKGMRTYQGPAEDDEFDDIDDPEAEEDIDEYLKQKREEEEDRQNDEDYDEWEEEYNNELEKKRAEEEEREEKKYQKDVNEESETEEEKYYDPWSKGDFANVNTKSFSSS